MKFIQSLAILAVTACACVAQNNVAKWDALSGLQGKTVTLLTTEGGRVQGTALRWQPDTFSIQVRKSTDAQRFPLGEMAVPRQNIRTIEVSRSTKKWRVIGTIVGLGVGLPAAAVSGFSAGGGFLSNDHQTRANTARSP